MKRKLIYLILLGGLFAGCVTTKPSAMVSGRTIRNPQLGLSGFTYNIPSGMVLHDSSGSTPLKYTPAQKLAQRVHEVGEHYHPRGNETFFESFLMLSRKTAFVLVTMEYEIAPSFDYLSSWTSIAPRWQVLPLFNVKDSRRSLIGKSRLKMFTARGQAFEKAGWYYSKAKPDRIKFSFEACKIMGKNDSSYLLMGFCMPGDEAVLASEMQSMIDGFQF